MNKEVPRKNEPPKRFKIFFVIIIIVFILLSLNYIGNYYRNYVEFHIKIETSGEFTILSPYLYVHGLCDY
jgi:hypothetical protein